MLPERKSEPPKIKAPKAAPSPGAKVEREKQKPLFDLPVSGRCLHLTYWTRKQKKGSAAIQLTNWNHFQDFWS